MDKAYHFMCLYWEVIINARVIVPCLRGVHVGLRRTIENRNKISMLQTNYKRLVPHQVSVSYAYVRPFLIW